MKLNSLRGMQDILPEEIHIWQHIEQSARELLELYNFHEIRTPLLEQAELFLRSIGEDTDIVEKEMYVFNDKKGRKVALRPEGTASVVRAYIQNSLFNNPAPQKFYYIGPMFRYERPQKGRFRQFHQIGVEAFGVSAPAVEAELLWILKQFFEKLNIHNLTYEINSLGCKKCRSSYRENLFRFLNEKVESFCDDCQRRFLRNPLRILDCKVHVCRELLKDTPLIMDFLCNDCRTHFSAFKKELEIYGIIYTVNPKIVRGIDYYTRTVFEVTTTMLGAQNAVSAGGRYDDLVSLFGGPPTPAAGFAIGVERLLELFKKESSLESKRPLVYVAYAGKGLEREVIKVVNILRDNGLVTDRAYENLSLKNQLKKADRLGVEWVIIVGEEEIKKSIYKYKKMKEGTQAEASLEEIIKLLREGK
ncbi:MAG: histidine--tRNA ligase [Thermodesulfovibrio sp.]|nr:histidine--tRNA ligase [Thermodesulfovibrio sp.]